MRLFVRPLLALVAIVLTASAASATPITITGNATGSNSTATGELTLTGTTLTLEITNTSPFDARITGLGFDLSPSDFDGSGPPSAGLNGFTAGSVVPNFLFRDTALGNVPQFGSRVLDFGWITGSNFAGGSPNNGLAPTSTLTFIVNGNFLGLTEAQVASALFVRFQRVGPNGDGSDVGQGTPGVPEPATLLLVGAGLAAAVARRRRVLRG